MKGQGDPIDRSEWPGVSRHRDLLELLDRLHRRAGPPSLGAITERMSINSRTRVSQMLRAKDGALPADARQVEELVRALGGSDQDIVSARTIFESIPGGRQSHRRLQAAETELLSYVRSKISRFGIKRTAYPIDMTLDEVVRQGLIVETAVRKKTGARSAGRRVGIRSVLPQIHAGMPRVLLGASGAGKTMIAYRAAAQLMRPQDRLAILLRADEVEEEAPTIFRLCESLDVADRPLIVLDGLDEALVAWRTTGGIPNVLADLLHFLPALVTARTRAFEESSELDAAGVGFEQIYELEEWSLESHFATYVHKLIRRGRLPDTTLLDFARSSPEIAKLASRPLHARMLAFLYETGGVDVYTDQYPKTEVDLYSSYIDKLARVADAGLARRGCPVSPDATSIWKNVAWLTYAGGAPATTSEAESFVGLSSRCRRSAIEYIADTERVRGHDRFDYLHYSFYEWLVASHVADGLEAQGLDYAHAYRVLKHDLPRDMRHFLVATMRPIGHERSQILSKAYWQIRHDVTLGERGRQLACNLVIYLIGRASISAQAELERIARRETDLFLLNSALWALSHLGSSDAVNDFAEQFANDDEWRTISRGYTLYYYGDLSTESGPPYRDDPPFISCSRAVAKVIDMLLDEGYTSSVPFERQVIDALVLFDIIRVRSNELANRELLAAIEVLDRMNQNEASPVAIGLLRSCVDELFMKGGSSP